MLRRIVLLGMLCTSACASVPETFSPDPGRSAELPAELGGLLALADRIQSLPGASSHELDRSLAALEAARKSNLGTPYELDWREARGASLLGRSLGNVEQRRGLIQQAIEAGGRAIVAEPERVEGHYFLAVALAFDAEEHQEMERIEPLAKRAARAVEINASYDDAGPLRLLGKVYLEAPEWPTSIGDKEQAVELLERAVELAPTALNQHFLGEAFFHDEQLAEAQEVFELALTHAGGDRLGAPWRALAKEYLEELGLAGFGGGAR